MSYPTNGPDVDSFDIRVLKVQPDETKESGAIEILRIV